MRRGRRSPRASCPAPAWRCCARFRQSTRRRRGWTETSAPGRRFSGGRSRRRRVRLPRTRVSTAVWSSIGCATGTGNFGFDAGRREVRRPHRRRHHRSDEGRAARARERRVGGRSAAADRGDDDRGARDETGQRAGRCRRRPVTSLTRSRLTSAVRATLSRAAASAPGTTPPAPRAVSSNQRTRGRPCHAPARP